MPDVAVGSSAQIPNQNSTASTKAECETTDQLRRLGGQINLLAAQMIKTCGANLPAWNISGNTVAIPTPKRNNWHNDAADEIANDLHKTLKNYLEDSLDDAGWHNALALA
jgi:hypothetical protein